MVSFEISEFSAININSSSFTLGIISLMLLSSRPGQLANSNLRRPGASPNASYNTQKSA